MLKLAVIAVLVALFVGAARWPAKPTPGMTFPGQVERAIDGDTIVVRIEMKVHVRLDGVWTPEIRGKEKPQGLIAKAKAKAKELSEGKGCLVMVPFRGEDLGDVTTLGRVVGTVWIDGQQSSLNEQMVEAGYGKK